MGHPACPLLYLLSQHLSPELFGLTGWSLSSGDPLISLRIPGIAEVVPRWLFSWRLGIQTQDLIFVQQALYLLTPLSSTRRWEIKLLQLARERWVYDGGSTGKEERMRMLGLCAPSQLPQFTAVRPDLLRHRLTNTLELQTIVFFILPPNANCPLVPQSPCYVAVFTHKVYSCPMASAWPILSLSLLMADPCLTFRSEAPPLLRSCLNYAQPLCHLQYEGCRSRCHSTAGHICSPLSSPWSREA